MSLIVILDSGPLGLLVYPRGLDEADHCNRWLEQLIATGQRVVLPEIVNYELRRELLRLNLIRGLERLDALKTLLDCVPLSTEAMIQAAALWADARRRGTPTADPQALDVDAILTAQARRLGSSVNRAVVATTNVGRLAQFVESRHWANIP